MYADPLDGAGLPPPFPSASPIADITAVSLLWETEEPKWSAGDLSEATIFCISVHIPSLLRSNIYAEPAPLRESIPTKPL